MMPAAWAVTVVILCIVVVIMAVIILGLMRQVTPILERAAASAGVVMPNGPLVGHPLPDFAAMSPEGEVTGNQLRDQPHILLFLSAGCGPCQALADEMTDADLGSLAGQLIIITTAQGREQLGLSDRVLILTEQGREVSDALSVTGTPSAIAVGADGDVKATRVANTVEHLRDLAAVL